MLILSLVLDIKVDAKQVDLVLDVPYKLDDMPGCLCFDKCLPPHSLNMPYTLLVEQKLEDCGILNAVV